MRRKSQHRHHHLLPLHPNKCVGPATSLTVLGIELDSIQQIAHLPEQKLLALRDLIQSWFPHHWCNRQELESLIGHLHLVAKVVWPGRTFLSRMIDSLCCFKKRDYPIRLNHTSPSNYCPFSSNSDFGLNIRQLTLFLVLLMKFY